MTDVSVALLTVRVVEPDTVEPEIVMLALIVVVPAAMPVATEPFMVATLVFDELHVT